MRVLQICAEIFPLLKTGGLADVTGALPPALRAIGDEVRTVLPGFAPILAGLDEVRLVVELPPRFGAAGPRVLHGRLKACDVDAYVIDAPEFYQREGGPYADARQQAWADNHRRFALLGWVGAQLAIGLDPEWRAEVLHAHDWHAALSLAYLRAEELAAGRLLAGAVYTVHNLAYQGMFPGAHFGELGLPPHFFNWQGLEFHQHINFMKAGLVYADRITTVSPTYAQEIQGVDQGCGLDGLLRERASHLSGVLNGVDEAVWNPATDPHLPARYSVRDLSGKARCKSALQQSLGLAHRPEAMLLCIVSRITSQKGLHLVLEALPELVQGGHQFALLGSGDHGMEVAFSEFAAAHHRSVAVRIGYDEPFAHQLIAGSDVICVPSLFEPCGLTQLYGLKYGTLPLVRRVGGLADTVTGTDLESLVDETATGFVFDDFDRAGLLQAVRRAAALHQRPKDWRTVQLRGMRRRLGWGEAAAQYHQLYELANPAPH